MGLAPDSSSADFPIVERSTEVRSVPRTPDHLRGLGFPLSGPPGRLPGVPCRAGPSSNLAFRFPKPSSNASSSPGPPFVSGLGMREHPLLQAIRHRSKQTPELPSNTKAGAQPGSL